MPVDIALSVIQKEIEIERGPIKLRIIKNFPSTDVMLSLPIPPSANRRQTISYRPKMTANGPKHILINTKQVRDYYEYATIIASLMREIEHRPITEHTAFHFLYRLADMRYDVHNGYKVVCDLLEKSSVIVNDRYILPQTLKPEHSKEHPELIITFPLNALAG